MMLKKILIAICICSTAIINAQKRTTFYNNKQKAFEGDCISITTDQLFVKNHDEFYIYHGFSDSRINTLRNGDFTSWYENGNKKIIGTYILNVAHGKFEFYFENGNKMAEGEFNYGFRIGKWITYYENGNKKMEGNYDKYFNEEELVAFLKSLRKIEVCDYYDHETYIREKCWHPQKWKDGNVAIIESELKENNSKKNGKFTFYRDNGIVEYECFYQNNLKHGQWSFYFSNAKLAKELWFESDSCKGKVAEYYDTGIKLYEGTVVGGIELVENAWNKKGEQVIKDGTGNFVGYFENGKTHVKRYYTNGLADKTWYTYFLEGGLNVEKLFKEGELKSQFFYDTNGNIYEEYFYQNNDLIRSIKHKDNKLIEDDNE